jgi:Family of unknown function (DUF6445)
VFSENIKVRSAPIYGGGHVFVIDNVLADPDSLVQFASRARSAFSREALGAFPGVELRMIESFNAKFETFFRLHLRHYFDIRRTLKSETRLSLATLTREQLRASHCIPYRIERRVTDSEAIIAFELHLFRDEHLGGIGFHEPINSVRDTMALWNDFQNMPDADALRKHRLVRNYCTASNAYFRLVRIVPPKFNRLVVFDGAAFHSAHIEQPEHLTRDVETGRLTLTGKFHCKRSVGRFANRWEA